MPRPAGLRATLAASLGVLALAACNAPGSGYPPPALVSLPHDAVVGAGDPTRAAVFNTAFAFGSPASIAGKPDEAARAAANFEFLTVEIPYGARYRGLNAILQPELEAGRAELRTVLGVRPEAPPQQVIDALYAAARALRAGDVAAADRILSGPAFSAGGAATLQRLAAMPLMPKVATAAVHTQQELDRADRIDRSRGGGGGGVGGRT
ncbi:MAG: hypothetical protein K2X49_17655 [Acetobacteraceae bacterium]|nr:hypothetical protein [Acetobacteraceae bacterium]